MDYLNIEGKWWTPDNPTNKVAGTLTFDPVEGATLKLFGVLGKGADNVYDILGEALSSAAVKVLPVIHGVGEGKEITLLYNTNTNLSFSNRGIIKQQFRSDLVLIGGLFPNPEEVKFQQLSLNYTHLHDWAQLYGLTLTYGDDGSIQAIYKKPQNVVIDLPNAVIHLANSGGVHIKDRYEYTLHESVMLVIDLHEPLSWDDCLRRYILPIRNFLTLATAHPNAPTQVNGRVSGKNPNGEAWNKVKVFFALRNRPERVKALYENEMIFNRLQVGDQLPSILAKWLEISDELEPVCDLLFGTMYNPKMYLNHRFLNLVQGLEAYHCRRFKNESIPKEEHKKRIKEILSAVPEIHQEWVKEKLKWSNEPSLKERLEELIEYVGPCMSNMLLQQQKEMFIKKVRDTRHYLTHYDKDLEKKAAKDIELYVLTQGVFYILVACILLETGFTIEKVKEFFETNQDFKYFSNLMKRYLK